MKQAFIRRESDKYSMFLVKTLSHDNTKTSTIAKAVVIHDDQITYT